MKRREFIKAACRAVAGASAGPLLLPRWARGAAPSEQIVMGIIGVGGMGGGHVNWFLNQPDVRVAAICDVDSQRRAEKLKRVHDHCKNTEARGYTDFRELLDRDDITAISCATPDHWHALVAISAFQAGKHVYCEKPLAHNYNEARAMLAARRRYSRVFQLGTQIHAGDNYHRVVELVRSGVLGRIRTVRVWKTGGTGMIPYSPTGAPPDHLDYNMWLGPAPWRPYHPGHVHFSFRHFLDFSTGVYADFWCHISDIAFWALELGPPLAVTARGELQTEGMADAPKRVEADFKFPGLDYHWTSDRPACVPGTVGDGIGCCFEGDRGTLVCDYGQRAIYADGKEHRDIPDVPRTIPRSPGHQRNFLDCVRSGSLTESNLPYAVSMTAPMFFGRISLLLGRPLKWDANREEFAGDEQANRMLGRACREPWFLPS